MTEAEAKEYMENEIRCIQRARYCDRDCAKCYLVKQEEPLLGSFGVAIEALEKQIPKQVKLYIGNDMSCPSCGHRLRGYEGIRNPYCKHCGQQLER